MKKILVTGANGSLAPYFIPALRNHHQLFFFNRKKINFDSIEESKKNIHDQCFEYKPEIIIHCAALTNVDFCEINQEKAFLFNSYFTKCLAHYAYERNIKFIYISTDQVYGGKIAPYLESNPCPINVYGQSKLKGEKYVKSISNYLILRLNYVGIGNVDRLSFCDWIIKSLKEKKDITLFNDVMFNPISGRHFSKILLELILKDIKGVYNIGCLDNGFSKSEFAINFANRLDFDISNVRINSIDTVNLNAIRPKDMRMNVKKISKIIKMPNKDNVIEYTLLDYIVNK